jgi:hypothetical protein
MKSSLFHGDLVSRSTFSTSHSDTKRVTRSKTSSHNTNSFLPTKKSLDCDYHRPRSLANRRWIIARLERVCWLCALGVVRICGCVLGKFTCDNAYIILLTPMARRALRETRAGRVKWVIGRAGRRRSTAVH